MCLPKMLLIFIPKSRKKMVRDWSKIWNLVLLSRKYWTFFCLSGFIWLLDAKTNVPNVCGQGVFFEGGFGGVSSLKAMHPASSWNWNPCYLMVN